MGTVTRDGEAVAHFEVLERRGWDHVVEGGLRDLRAEG